MASLSATITSQDNDNSSLVTIMVDNGASGHYFNDVIIRDPKHCLQDYVHLTLRKILSTGGALLDGTAEGVLQGRVTDNNDNRIFIRVDILVPGIERKLFSVMQAAKWSIVIIFDYENPRLEGFHVTVPLRSESGDFYSFVLDSREDGYGTKELAINAVANAQVWRWRLGHLHAQSLGILRKRDCTGITFEGAVWDCDVCTVGKTQQLTSRQPTTRPTSLSSCATGT